MKNKYLTASDLNRFVREYTLIESKSLRRGSILYNIELDRQNGEVRLKANGTVANLLSEARQLGKHEIVLYGLAKVWISGNVLEYMCEVVLDLRVLASSEKIESLVRFGRGNTFLKVTD